MYVRHFNPIAGRRIIYALLMTYLPGVHRFSGYALDKVIHGFTIKRKHAS